MAIRVSQNNRGSKAVAATAAVALLSIVLLTGSGLAGTYPPGSIVSKSDYDATAWPSGKSNAISLCAVDLDGDGALDTGEPLYIDIDSTTCTNGVEPKDIRVTPNGDLKPGKEVKMTDADSAYPFIGPIVHFVRYHDLAGDGEFGSDSVLYLDLMNTASGKVGVGDVRITAFGEDGSALSHVLSGAPDLGIPLTNIHATANTLVSTDPFHVVYKANSAWYVNAKVKTLADGVTEKDVRLTDKAEAVPDAKGTVDTVVTAVSVRQTSVAPGAPFQVVLSVENQGDGTGAGLVETLLGDEVVDARGTPTLAPKGAVELVVTLVAPLAPGGLHIAAGDQVTTLTVEGAAIGTSLSAPVKSAAEPAPDVTDDEGTPKTAGASAAGEASAVPFVGAILIVIGALAFALAPRRG